MSSTGGNIDKSFELLQKTYDIQNIQTNTYETSHQTCSSVIKISTHQPLRKTSVHDINEITKHDLEKVLFNRREIKI